MCDIMTIGLLASMGGTVAQGFAAQAAGNETADRIEAEKRTRAALNSIEDQRVRGQFRHQIADQRAELIERGVDPASPTAIYLGQQAAREMTFASQSVRQTGLAEQAELSAQASAARARGRMGMIQGVTGAAGVLLNKGPRAWPELLA